MKKTNSSFVTVYRSRRLLVLVTMMLAFLVIIQMAAAAEISATRDAKPVSSLLSIEAVVEPVFVPGNPTCVGQGYDFGFKPQPEPPPSDTYFFPDGIHSVSIISDGTYFDWLSDLGIDAVIVKGGSNANLYIYDPPAESFGDSGLHSPINPNNGNPYAISHIEFCYDYEVDVSKSVTTTYTRTFEWQIDKSVTPEEWNLFTGDSGTSQYTVSVTKTGYTDSDWAVNGMITIENDTPYDATITGVSDVVSDSIAALVTCPVAFPHVLLAGQSLACTYSTNLPNADTRTNTATVSTTGIVGGNSVTEDVIFDAPTTIVNDEINVIDTNGMSWKFSESGSQTYEKTFACDSDKGVKYNIATIGETGQTDDATVIVNCHALAVSKDAQTSFDRNWDWTIVKTADQSSLTLSLGQQFLVNYNVYLTATSMDSNYAAAGAITISNPHPTRAATLTAVSDIVSPDIAATVVCPALTVPAGGSLFCTYSADLPDAAGRTNTATATLQNYDFASDGAATAAGTTAFSGSADVTFSDTPTIEYDECIDASDTFAGFLGTVCAADSPITFAYSRWVGPYAVCGDHQVQNIASFITNDTAATGSDNWTVIVDVPCAGGCTLTQGYWKTHSEYGPAPYDDTWALLSDGADTPFFGTGYSYYEILWMPPKGGNAYLILAHQYIAAELNILNGASAPQEVQDALAAAEGLLVKYEAELVIPRKGPDQLEAITLAALLDDYNNGYVGPGHCSE